MSIIKLNNNALTSITSLPSGVGQDPDVKIDIARLGLRVFANQNLAKQNSNSASFDVFQDSTGITNLTNTTRDSSEYISSIVTSTSTSTITLNSSNYLTYLDNTDNDALSIVMNKSGASYYGTSGLYNPATDPNGLDFNSSSDYQASQQLTESTEWTTLGYMFATNSSDTQYLLQNYTTSGIGSYRMNFINFRFKTGVTFKPNGDFGMRWRNGQSGFSGMTLYGNSDTDNTLESSNIVQVAEISSSVTNGSSYADSFSNSTFYPALSIRVYHGSSGNSYMFDQLSIQGDITAPTQSLSASGSFEGATITAGSSTTKMGAVITYIDQSGTNALNSDLVLKLSADNGSNYSTATLTALPDFSSGVKCCSVADLSVTAGTQLKYKIELANQSSGSKECRVTGISLQY